MLKRFMSNEFNRNVLKLMTGSTMAQAIPIAISPILTRLYTPEDFGVLALFVAITVIFGSIANARYELAIVLPEKEEDAINLVALSILIAFSLSTILLIIVLLFHNRIVLLLGNEDIGLWLYLVPLVVFFVGFFNALNYLNTRMKNFGLIAKVKVIKSLTLSTVQLGLGFLKSGALGLISGQIISHVFTNMQLAKSTLANKVLISKVNLKSMLHLGREYSNFPKFSMWAVLANSLSQHLLNFYLPLLYSLTSLGYYSLVQRILGMPTSIIGNSVGQVFFQKASDERREIGNAKKVFSSTVRNLILLSLIPFTFLFIFGPDLIAFVFGDQWREAGRYITILVPLFLLRFINTPISTITSVFEKNHIALVLQISYLSLTLIVLLISFILRLDIINFLIIYSVIFSIYNIIRLLVFRKISLGVLYDEKN